MLQLNKIIESLMNDFSKTEISQEQLNKILKKIVQGHTFILKWNKDRPIFQALKNSSIFNRHIDDDKKGWMQYHDFPITLEILNKSLTPSNDVSIKSMGGVQKTLIVYYALCPELENFVTIIIWPDSKSSMNAWSKISDLILQKNETNVLQFSKKCGIALPNKIHPYRDNNQSLIPKKSYASLYDWRLAYYLFDDGRTILSHVSPLNFRQVIFDKCEQNESIINMRTTIGRLDSITNNALNVNIPYIFGSSRSGIILNKFKSFENTTLEQNSLYFFQIYDIVGTTNIEIFVKSISKATPIDIIGMFLVHTIYLLHMHSRRLKILNEKQLKKLFDLYCKQIKFFCVGKSDELNTIQNINLDYIKSKYLDAFTMWFNSDLYMLPPILKRHLEQFNSKETREKIIQEFDKSLKVQKNNCFSNVPSDSNGNRMFDRKTMAKINKIYSYVHFIVCSKRFILDIGQNLIEPSHRDEQIEWIKEIIESD